MSLILDALNRSRQDVGDIPGLESQHLLTEEPRSIGSRLWPLAMVVALGVIAYLLYERGGDGEPVSEQKEEQREEQGPVAAPVKPVLPVPAEQTVAKAAPETVAPKPIVKTEMSAAPAEQARQPATPDAAVAALYGDGSTSVKAGAEPVVEQPKRPAAVSPPARSKPTVSEQPVNVEQIVRQAESDLEDARLEEHDAPFLSNLSQQAKNDIPTIFYERHDYSGRPGQSSVVLSGKTLKPGGKTGSGVRVDEILPDSVVLSYRGTQFRLRALNSWVNL